MGDSTEISTDRPPPRTTLTIDFGLTGNSDEFVSGGWSVPEHGFRWMISVESALRFEWDFIAGDYIIELALLPFIRPPKLAAQRLTISVNGFVVGVSTIARGGRFGYRIPAAALAGRQTTSIVFSHPDAGRPSDFGQSDDTRLLAVSVERLSLSRIRTGAPGRLIGGTGGIAIADFESRVGLPPDRFILNFESLGDNCEFGLVQRRCGAEPFLSLLRFAGMELPNLLHALDVAMQNFGDPANVEIKLDDKTRPEFVVHERRYQASFHTFRYQGETNEGALLAGETKRLAYCARRFIGELKRGNKIFVVKRNEALQKDEILPLFSALSSYGRNFLLWMVPADSDHASGCVEVVIPGLFKGFINRFAPHEDAHDLLLEDWLEVCANAYRSAREDGMVIPDGAST